jgi:His-Xaa-Ser system protein HxsD
MEEKILKFKQELYPKQAVMKAAYHFIDKCYIHVDVVDNEYVIDIKGKKVESEKVALEFENELLAQTVRYQVYLQTHVIREVLMARAMSSTITGSATELKNNDAIENVDSLENILADWFDKNED